MRRGPDANTILTMLLILTAVTALGGLIKGVRAGDPAAPQDEPPAQWFAYATWISTVVAMVTLTVSSLLWAHLIVAALMLGCTAAYARRL